MILQSDVSQSASSSCNDKFHFLDMFRVHAFSSYWLQAYHCNLCLVWASSRRCWIAGIHRDRLRILPWRLEKSSLVKKENFQALVFSMWSTSSWFLEREFKVRVNSEPQAQNATTLLREPLATLYICTYMHICMYQGDFFNKSACYILKK